MPPKWDYVTSSAAGAEQSAAGSPNLPTITLGAAVAVGDVIVGMAGFDATGGANLTNIIDNLGNVYFINNDQIHNATHNQDGRTFYCLVTVAGTPTLTPTFSAGGSGSQRLIAAIYRPDCKVVFGSSRGQSQTGPGTGTDAIKSPTLPHDGGLAVGLWQNIAEGAPGTGVLSGGTNFTRRLTFQEVLGIEDWLNVSPAILAATFTDTVDHDAITHIVVMLPEVVPRQPNAPSQTFLSQELDGWGE